MKSPPLFEKELSGDFYSTPIYPPSSNSSPSVAYLFSWQAAGKIASHSIQELFIRAYEPCFFRTLSLPLPPRISVGNMKIRWKFYNFTIFSRDSRIVRKIRKFEKFCYNYCVRVQQPIVTSVGILNIFLIF